jgi:DNA-binding PadR family transcriptional regulator
VLLPIELDILQVASAAAVDGDAWVHGFALAKLLRDARGSARLTAHGTLYKALGRLATGGLLADRWEEPERALAEGRPRRRLYRITAAGQRALANAQADVPARVRPTTRRIAPA